MLAELHGLDRAGIARLGSLVAGRVADDWPGLDAELAGMAEGSEVAPELLWAVNARTELLGGTGECSLIGRLEGARVTVEQKWDWHPALLPSRIVWSVEHDATWFTTVTEAGMLAKLGLNGRGLACGLNFLRCSLDGGAAGMPVHVLLRLVLQECESLAEAIGLLLGARTSASSCITVAGAEAADAGLVAVELSPAGAIVQWPGSDGVLVHTNHFLDAPPGGADPEPAEHPSTLLRRRRLADLVAAGTGDEHALACHFPKPEAVCRHVDPEAPWPERRATLLSLRADPAAPSLYIAPGPPCAVPFESVALP